MIVFKFGDVIRGIFLSLVEYIVEYEKETKKFVRVWKSHSREVDEFLPFLPKLWKVPLDLNRISSKFENDRRPGLDFRAEQTAKKSNFPMENE